MPIDDNHCWRYLVGGSRTFAERESNEPLPPRRPILPTEQGMFRFPDGAEIDTRLAKFRRDNRYGMDRHKQRTLSFTGIPFIPTQDQAMTEGMGYVCDRTEEHLGSSDVAIIHMRRTMLRLVENLQKGIEPYAATHPERCAAEPLAVVSDFADLDRVLDEYKRQALFRGHPPLPLGEAGEERAG